MISSHKIILVSLGCSKNLVDSENMLGLLKDRGFHIVSRMEEAQIAVINTCGFIQSAVEETIETILAFIDRKKRGRLEKIFVTGCFVQRYGYKLREEMPEVDGWVGTGEIGRIGDVLEARPGRSSALLINRPKHLSDHRTPRVQTTPFYSAFLKIAEGCSHQCSYCTIPALRGPFRSREKDSLIIEAEGMAARGVREINLIAQDTTHYGGDFEDNIGLEDLLIELLEVEGIKWLRILYGHPHRISDRLLKLMEREDKICPYLDIPLQHCNVDILKAMGRTSKRETPMELLERVRSISRPLSLRTTLMVGFPGETDEIFQELYDFVKTVAFDHLGSFVYSPEKGTPAARLKDSIDRKTAEERQEIIMGLQKDIIREKNIGMKGKIVPVLIEGPSPETDLLLRGRTAEMAPDVDSQVLINKGMGTVGEIVSVKITEAHPYDLVGEII